MRAVLPAVPSVPSLISELTECCAVFVPGVPARTGTVAFWQPEGLAPPPVPWGAAADLTVALPGAEDVEGVTVPAVLLSVRAALPVLTRARSSALAHRACVFWGAAALLALDCAARGLLLPGLCESGHDAWRAGPLGPEDTELIRRLAASMPLEACAVPLSGTGTLLLAPEGLLRGFLDAVADTPPRSPAASLAAGGAAFAAKAPQFVPRRASRAADVAAAYDAGVRLSLRIEVSGPVSAEAGPRFCAVPQLHAVSDPALVVDAAEVWTGTPSAERPGPRARTDALLALPRTAPVWPALERLLSAAVPVAVDLDDEDVTVLLRDAARAPAAAGFEVQWPMELHRRLTTGVLIGASSGQTGTPPGVDGAVGPLRRRRVLRLGACAGR
ncbi:hypothetical protein [Streptomyces sp. NPDC057386]|uniref:Uncharacterized protein n=1 Tax=Streptomyces thermocoprophilus TaxID=78356 RepID=A0ABV5V854_9ACTN